MRTDLSPSRVRTARLIAGVADALQIMILPFFVEGSLSPFNAALDVAVGASLIYLLGWHWALLPTFLTEMAPIVDLAPTWSIAVFVATGMGPAPHSPTTVSTVPTPPAAAPPQVGPGDPKN